jgi:hypothetical protein
MASSTITFTRDQSSASATTVNFILGGTATYGTDYNITGAATITATGGTAIIPGNSLTTTITVNTIPDSIKEADESVIITPIAGVGYTAQGSVFLTIQNDEFIALTYSSDGDSSGLFYYLGTSRQTTAWALSNMSNGVVTTFNGSAQLGGVNSLFDRNTATTFRGIASTNSAFYWDLGITYSMSVNKYSIRSGVINSPADWPRNWKIQGTNQIPASFSEFDLDALTWTDIDVQINNTTLNTIQQWLTITPNGSNTSFRYLRYQVTGQNLPGASSLNLSEIEFYGIYT